MRDSAKVRTLERSLVSSRRAWMRPLEEGARQTMWLMASWNVDSRRHAR